MSDVRVQWFLDVVDRGGPARVLREDRSLRRSVEQTDRAYRRQAATVTDAMRRAETGHRRAVQRSGQESRAARTHAGEVRRLRSEHDRLAASQSRLASSASRVTGSYRMQARAARDLAAAERTRARAAEQATRSASSAAGRGIRAGPAALGVAGAGGLVGGALRIFAGFEQQMDRVAAVSGAGERQLARLSEQAKRLGATTNFSNREAAGGMYQLATAGFKVREIMKAIPGTMDLAAASGTDLAESAMIQAASLRAFELPARKAGHVADVMALAVNRSAIEMSDLGETMKYVGPVAGRFNQRFEDIAASAALLGDVGIKGSQAGTTLRRAFVNLVRPSERTLNVLDDVGISMQDFSRISTDAEGKLRPFPEILGRLSRSLEDAGPRDRRRTIAQLFGVEALPGMLTLLDKGQRGIERMSGALQRSDGTARRTARTMRDNVAGAFDQFTGSVETAATSIVERFGPDLTRILRNVTGEVGRFASNEGTLDTIEGTFRTLGTAAVDVGEALLPVAKTGVALVKVFDALPDGVSAAVVQFGALALITRRLAGTAAFGALAGRLASVRGHLRALPAETAAASAGMASAGAAGPGVFSRFRTGYRNAGAIQGPGFMMAGQHPGILGGIRGGIGGALAGRGRMIAGGAAATGLAGAVFGGGSVAGGAIAGAATGAMAGPWGAAIGALAGGATSAIVGAFKGASERRAREEAERFANRTAQGVGAGISAGMQQGAAQSFGQARASMRTAVDRMREARERTAAPAVAGRGAGLAPGQIAALSDERLERALAEQRAAGEQLSKALADGMQSGAHYLDPSVILRQFYSAFGGADPEIRKAGAQRILDFALAMQRQGRLSRGDVERIASNLGDAFGVKLGRAGSQATREFVAKAARNLRGRELVEAVNQQTAAIQSNARRGFQGLPRITARSLSGAASVLREQMDWMRNKVRTSTGQQRDDAKAALAELRQAYRRTMRSLTREVGAGADEAVRKIDRIRDIVRRTGESFAEVRDRIDDAAASIKDFPEFPNPLADLSVAPMPGDGRGRHGGRNRTPAFSPLDNVPNGRRGGYFYRDGGLVPARVSPGEVIVTGAGQWRVPGEPTAADSVFAALPAGSAVLTWDGQQQVAAGASIEQAIRTQAPHFRDGGVVPGRYTSTSYGPPWGGIQGTGTTATGVNLRRAPHVYGVAVDPQMIPLGSNVYIRPNPFNRAGPFRAFDTGGAIDGRRVDFYDWRGRASQLAWGRRTVTVSRGGRDGGDGGGLDRDLTARIPVNLARSRRRRGLIRDAFSTAYERARERQRPRDIAFALSRALRDVRTSRKVDVPGAGGGPRGGGGARGNERLTRMTSFAANASRRWPNYSYGGGHNAAMTGPYDCSGYVSALLAAGGFIRSPMSTDGLKTWGVGGNGKAITIGVRGSTGRNAHTMMRIGNTYWEAGGSGVGRRSGWSGSFPIKRHPRGYRRGGVIGRVPAGIRARIARDPGLLDPRHPDFVGYGLREGGTTPRATLGQVRQTGGIGAIRAFAETLDDATTGYLNRLRRDLLAQVRRGGSARIVSRLQAALSAIENALGGRIGRIVGAAERQLENAAQVEGFVDRDQRRRGVDGTSAAGLRERSSYDLVDVGLRQQAIAGLQRAKQKALRSGQRGTAREIEDAIREASVALDEAFVAQIERKREIMRAEAQEGVDRAQFGVDLAQIGLAGVDVAQRLDRTADTPGGMVARAGAIENVLMPQLRANQGAALEQLRVAQQLGDEPAIRAATLAVAQAGNDIASAMADAGDLVRDAALRVAQERVEGATHETTMDQLGLARLELEQRVAGTYEGGGTARADYIRGEIIPALEAERVALAQQQQTAREQGDETLATQIAEALAGKQNEILQATLDATEQIADNTAPRSFGSSIGLAFGDETLTDLTVGVGNGA